MAEGTHEAKPPTRSRRFSGDQSVFRQSSWINKKSRWFLFSFAQDVEQNSGWRGWLLRRPSCPFAPRVPVLLNRTKSRRNPEIQFLGTLLNTIRKILMADVLGFQLVSSGLRRIIWQLCPLLLGRRDRVSSKTLPRLGGRMRRGVRKLISCGNSSFHTDQKQVSTICRGSNNPERMQKRVQGSLNHEASSTRPKGNPPKIGHGG